MRRCGCGSVPIYVDGCGRRTCAICGYSKSKASAKRVIDRLLYSGDRVFQFLVLTVPEDLREVLATEDGHKTWATWLRRFVRWLKRDLGVSYGYIRSHPCGNDPVIFHPHANLIFVQKPGLKGFRRGRLPVTIIREKWAGIIGWPGTVNVHAQYVDVWSRAGKARLGHHVRYIERHFPGWAWGGQRARWYCWTRKYGRETITSLPPKPTEEEKGFCPVCGRLFTYGRPEGAEILAVAVLEAWLQDGRAPPRYVEEGLLCEPQAPTADEIRRKAPPIRREQGALFD